MKLSDVKAKIDEYFDRISPEEVIAQFEELGCEFEPNPIVLPLPVAEYAIPPTSHGPANWWIPKSTNLSTRISFVESIHILPVNHLITTADQFSKENEKSGNYSYTMSA